MTNKQISCAQYDYIEIVCMNRYPIKLTLKDGSVIECTALDTKLNENRVECVKVRKNESERLIELADVTQLQIAIDNPHFDSVSFN